MESNRSLGLGFCLDMGSTIGGQGFEDFSNSCDRGGIKRLSEGISVELEGQNHGKSDFVHGRIEGELMWKKPRVSDTIDDKCGAVEGSEIEEENKKSLRKRESEKQLGPDSGCDNGSTLKWEFDLNEPAMEEECGGSETNVQECTQIGPVVAERRVEIIDISSDEGEKLFKSRDDRGKDKETEKGFTYEITHGLDFNLGTFEKQRGADGSSLMGGGRRYTSEEKGKAKIVDSWLSLATYPTQVDLIPEMQGLINCEVSQVSNCIELYEAVQMEEAKQLGLREEEALYRAQALRRKEEASYRAQVRRRTENAVRFREVVRRLGPRLAQPIAIAYPQHEKYNLEALKQKQELETPSMEADIKLEDLSDPFSSALKIIRERNVKRSAEQLIEWKAIENHNSDIWTPPVPSLLDLSLKVLGKNAEAIASLNHVPDWLKQRLTKLLCDTRKMDTHILDLLVRGSPTEIRVKDCSWITEKQLSKTLGKFDKNNLRVLQLDLCGQCSFDDIMCKSLARSSNCLPCLGIISLRGACRLSDNTLKALLTSAPMLQSINLGQCSLLTYVAIKILADSLGTSLRELYIDDCQRIDAMLIVSSLKKFGHLEVLSVAGIETVCDEFVRDIITACGGNLKELDLANCLNLTNVSLEAIGKGCPELCSLNISNLHKLTDLGMCYLGNGCRSVQALKLCRNRFSDEAIAAYLEASGESLKELSLNGVSKVGPSTALSLAKCSRKLSNLDLSWCRRITNEALGLIVDSCLSMKLLKLFGCTQITNTFLNGRSNLLVQIVGLNLTPLLEHVNMFEPKEVLLRYSPLQNFAVSEGVADRQNV